jgi:putative Holliday junction resolvase
MSLPNGRRLAIDFGEVRCGLAISDHLGLIATPFETLATEKVIDRISSLCQEDEILTIYIGLPAHLSGKEGVLAALARRFAKEISALNLAPVHLVDERLTTKSASSSKSLVERYGVDAVAAAKILELALAGEKSSGLRFGEALYG